MKAQQQQAPAPNRGSAHTVSQQAPAPPGLASQPAVQRMAVIQMAITDEVTVAVPGIAQSDTNLCWAASGWSIHRALGGTGYGSELLFVTGQANAASLVKYNNNRVNDIDNIIGSGSTTNHLTGSDSSGSFQKAMISRQLGLGKPILANVNNNHYVVICGKHKNNGDYKLQIMDPASGNKSWVSTDSGTHTGTAGGYSLSVLYFT